MDGFFAFGKKVREPFLPCICMMEVSIGGPKGAKSSVCLRINSLPLIRVALTRIHSTRRSDCLSIPLKGLHQDFSFTPCLLSHKTK